MQEYACYSVITPEGCAAILYGERTPQRVSEAAAALRVTAPDLLQLGVIDEVIAEPLGGAHRRPQEAAAKVGDALGRHLDELSSLPVDELLARRAAKYGRMGEIALTTLGAAGES
jgi:acetyl-CoA carboxylase alpha subunit